MSEERKETMAAQNQESRAPRNNDNRPQKREFKGNRKPRRNNNRRDQRQDSLESKVIKIKRVTKVVKGGRRFSFSALVVVGDRKGSIGFGTGKANEVPTAIQKAEQAARANVRKVKIVNGTLPHEVIGRHQAAKILFKPAAPGTGVKAGGSVRPVLELAGITDVLSKSLGSRISVNMVRATFDALSNLRLASEIAKLRGKSIKEITKAKEV